MNLCDYLKQASRGSGTALAAQIGVAQPTVSEWSTGKKAIPAEHCKAIERLTGGLVTCQEMRPADWHKYWPELASAGGVDLPSDAVAQATPAKAAPECVAITLNEGV